MSETRRQREAKRIRLSFLDAARVLLVKEGYDALTMRKVAERAEYSAAAIYTHFADKGALIRELCAHDFAIFARTLEKVMAVAEPRARLVALADAYIEFAIEYPEHYRLLFLNPKTVDEKAKHPEGPEADAYIVLQKTVEYAIAKGMFANFKKKPELVAQCLWAGMHGSVALQLVFEKDPIIGLEPTPLRAALMRDLLIDGLQTATVPRVVHASSNVSYKPVSTKPVSSKPVFSNRKARAPTRKASKRKSHAS